MIASRPTAAFFVLVPLTAASVVRADPVSLVSQTRSVSASGRMFTIPHRIDEDRDADSAAGFGLFQSQVDANIDRGAIGFAKAIANQDSEINQAIPGTEIVANGAGAAGASIDIAYFLDFGSSTAMGNSAFDLVFDLDEPAD